MEECLKANFLSFLSESLFEEAECFPGGTTCELVRIHVRASSSSSSDERCHHQLHQLPSSPEPLSSLPSTAPRGLSTLTADVDDVLPLQQRSSPKSRIRHLRHHRSHPHLPPPAPASVSVFFSAFGRHFRFRLNPDVVSVRSAFGNSSSHSDGPPPPDCFFSGGSPLGTEEEASFNLCGRKGLVRRKRITEN